MLSGTVPSLRAGEPVTVFARRYGEPDFMAVATVATRERGRWRYIARPAIHTAYRADWQGRSTSMVAVNVRPRLDLDARRGVLYARARAARALEGRSVVLQRRSRGGRWRAVRTLVLDARSRARTPARVPRGRSFLRLYMPAEQAGPGYIAGYSAVLVYTSRA